MDQDLDYSIKVYKQYFNFASSHFLIFKNGEREPLHGHNYNVKVRGHGNELEADVVFDFLDLKPIVREVCDSLDHKLLLPANNPFIEISETVIEQSGRSNITVTCPDGDFFSFPKADVLILPIRNTSAERLAIYISYEVEKLVKERFNFSFTNLEIEVEETPGQSAVFERKLPIDRN